MKLSGFWLGVASIFDFAGVLSKPRLDDGFEQDKKAMRGYFEKAIERIEGRKVKK
ncbi:hypothetical protein GTO10_04270 [Candidatus Saccharibacteria bacterium]|nr:hypothetical protein [Candidatus Aenigmarchaeota archaeon]NIT04110.1 hypothetical protein [Candidatus Saccharibacteria bacterium]